MMPRSPILFAASAAFFVAAAMLRQYRPVTLVLAVALAGWAAFTYWRERQHP
jgi:hypothetical protein